MTKYIYWLLPVGWMGVIFYSSSQPYGKQDVKPLMDRTFDLDFLTPYLDWISLTYHHSEVSTAALGVEGFIEFFMRKGAHAGVFLILLALLFAALRKTTRLNYSTSLTVSFLLTAAYAVTDELHQIITPNRTPYWGDVLIDVAGALMAVLLLLWLQRYRGQHRAA